MVLIVVNPFLFTTDEVFKLVICKSYVLVLEDACQVKSTLLLVSEVLVPVSHTFPLAGAVKVTAPGGWGGGGSPPPSPESPPSPLHEKIKNAVSK